MLPSGLGLALLLLTWRLGDGGPLILAGIVIWIAGSEYACRFLAASAITPYLPMALSPLLLLHYSSVTDFRIRLACFLMLAYILFLAWRPAASRPQVSLSRVRPWQAWFFSLLAFSLTAVVLHQQGIQLSGDEPHYVMIAQSLVEDGDFDLRNNLENRTYFAYLPVEVRFHGTIHNGRYHSYHLPGVSFLMVPFYLLFKLLGGLIPGSLYFRLAAALINSLFALGLFGVLRTADPENGRVGLFPFFLLTFPLLFHSVHLFPELPAAALAIFAYLLGRDRRRYFLAGLLLAGIPWLHLKYSLPALLLALFLASRIWKQGRARAKEMALLLIAPAASLALLGTYSKILYGSFHPGIISPEKNFLAIPFHFRIETLLSFFLDQRDGLLVYAPIFLLVFLAFKKEVRAGIRDFALLSTMFISYVLFHAFTTVRGGYSPAARPTLFVMWIMAIFLAALYRRSATWIPKALFRLLAGLTIFSTAWLLYYPLFLYQPVTREVTQRASALLLFLGSEAVRLASFFPSYLKTGNASHGVNWIWLAALALGLGLYYAKPAWPRITGAARRLLPCLGIGLLFIFCYFPHVQLQNRYSAGGLSFYCNSRNFSHKKELDRFKILAGQDYDLFIDLDGSAAERCRLTVLNGDRASLEIKSGRRTILARTRAPESLLDLDLPGMAPFRLGKRRLIHLGLESRAERSGVFFWLQFH